MSRYVPTQFSIWGLLALVTVIAIALAALRVGGIVLLPILLVIFITGFAMGRATARREGQSNDALRRHVHAVSEPINTE